MMETRFQEMDAAQLVKQSKVGNAVDNNLIFVLKYVETGEQLEVKIVMTVTPIQEMVVTLLAKQKQECIVQEVVIKVEINVMRYVEMEETQDTMYVMMGTL